MIIRGNSDKFDSRGVAPYRYAVVLACTQRFGEMIEYLWNQGEIFPAVHLAVACLHHGLFLPQGVLGQASSPAALRYSTMVELFFNRVLSTNFSIESMITYMSVMNLDWTASAVSDESFRGEISRSQEEVKRILVELISSCSIPSLNNLIGELSLAGGGGSQRDIEKRGLLYKYFDEPSVRAILDHCARFLLHEKQDALKAMHLFKINESFSEVVDMLCSHLARSMEISQGRTTRGFWLEQAQEFYDKNLIGGHGVVTDRLLQDGREGLGQDLRILIQVANALIAFESQRWQDCLKYIDESRIIPQSKSDIQIYVTLCQSLHHLSYVFKVIDSVLVMAIECVCKVLIDCRENRSIEQGMQCLERAESIISYSREAKVLRRETVNQITQIWNTNMNH